MSEVKDEIVADEPVVREVGERVSIAASFEPSTVKDLGDGVFEAVVTTSEIDRTGESIDTNGLTTDGWVNTGMPVLYGHDYSGLPIGKGLSFKQMKNKLTARFQLAVEEYPFAKTVADMIKGGYLNAVSIGGTVKQWNENYTVIEKMDMVEFSVVPVPANASAVITARSLEEATGKTKAEIAREYQDFATRSIADKLKSLDNDEIQEHIKTLERLLTILKANAEKEVVSNSEQEVIKLTLKKSANELARTSEKIIRLVKK